MIVDNHPVIRQGLQAFLQTDSEIEIIGVAVDGLDGVQKTRELKPHVVLMDLNMPKLDGIEATAIIKQEMPEVRVLILTFMLSESVISKILTVGADAYMTKGDSSDKLLQTIKKLV